MLKALIADDEMKICQLILKLGEWEALGIEIVGICHDGNQCWELINRVKPDIVLMDIRMPGYSGMELLEKTSRLHQDIAFIIISGYPEFEYAQKAIQFHAKEFLVKPIDAAKLNQSLRRVAQEFRDKRDLLDLAGRYTAQEHYHKTIRKQQALERLLSDDTLAQSGTDVVNELCGTSFGEGYYQVYLINTLQPPGTSYQGLEMQQESGLKKLYAKNGAIEIFHRESMLTCIAYDHTFCPEFQRRCRYRTVYHTVRNSLGQDCVMGIGIYGEGLTILPDSWRTAQSAEREKLLSSYKDIILFEDLKPPAKASAPLVSGQELRSFEIAALRRDTEALSFHLKTVQSRISAAIRSDSITADEIFSQCERLSGKVLEAVQPVEEQSLLLLEKLRARMKLYLQFHDLFHDFCEVLSMLLQNAHPSANPEETQLIRKAKVYIHQHYGEQIALTDVAEYCGVSHAYLSRQFKYEAKENFVNYLTDLRMDTAKRLLRTTNLRIGEIAKSVGYINEDYFCRQFKKLTGFRPADYRKLF